MRRLASGFTLIELVVTMILMSVLATVGSVVVMNGLQSYYASDNELSTLAKLRYSTQRIIHELREIQYTNPLGPYVLTATYPTTTNGSITFTKVDATEVTIDGSTSSITMQYDAGPAYTLTDGLTNLTFNFYQINGTAATSAANVAYIEVNLTLTLGANTYVQRARIGLRDNI